MSTSKVVSPLTEAEVCATVERWFENLDRHAPVEELLPLLATEGLEMRFPEAALRGQHEFAGWYDGVTRRFFDEVHVLKAVVVTLSGSRPTARIAVNWQARTWNPPQPRSNWLGFDAAQTWVLERSPLTNSAVIATYVVDALTPMEGSASL
jgi:hypothetical protein